MKKIILLSLIAFSSCTEHKSRNVIEQKYYTINGVDLPKNVCSFYYRDVSTGLSVQLNFQDSCHKYNIGDTLKN